MRRVGKGFFRVDTPLFEGMLVPQQVQVDIDAAVEDDDAAEPTSPTPATTPPTQQELIPSTSQVAPTPPPSPHQSPIASPSSPPQQQQPSQPLQTTDISMDLLNKLLETCTTLTKKVGDLEQDKIAQAIKITKLKQRVRKLEKKRKLKASGLKRLRKEGKIAKKDADEDVTLVKVAAEVTKDAKVQGRLEESQAKVYHLDLEHAQKVLSMQDDEADPAKLIEVVTTAKLMTEVVTAAAATTVATTITAALMPTASATRRRKGIVTRDPKETTTPSVIVLSEPKSKDKGKGILVEEPKPLKKQAHIEHDEAYARELEAELNANINWNEVIEQVKRKEKQDNAVMRYQALKRKPQTKAHARKNMMAYLKNMAGFKMNLFKGEEELEEKASKQSKRKNETFKEKAAKKQKLDEEVEEIKTYLQMVPNDEDDVYTEATPLALKVPVVDYQIHTKNSKPYYKIIRADGTHHLFLSFISLLMNFDREDLEKLWKIVQERFTSSKPKNFSDEFLLNTLKTMFEKPNVEAHIWKSQRGSYGLAKVKSWKLLESYRVYIITFTTTQMILLVERRYPLTRFTLDQMLNNVRLEVEEESEVSLELLRFVNIKFRGGLLGLNNVLISVILILFSFGVDAVKDFKEYMDYYCWLLLVLTKPNPQFPVIHPPPQETSIKIFHDQENAINSVQTFLRKFNRYSFFKTPKVLLLAWDRVFKIKDAFGTKQYKPDDIQELFHKLFNDVQNIHEELAEYINTQGWNRPAFYNNDDDDDVDYTITITPVLSTEEPNNSLSIGDEHLNTILATKSDEVIKSSVEDLVPIPSESEGIHDTMCDVRLVNNPTPLEAKDHFEIVINSNDDYSSSDDDSLYNENIEYVEASPHDFEHVSLEVAEIVIPEDEEIEDDNLQEISSSSTTTHSDMSLPNYEAFYFYDDHIEEISSGSTTTHSDISLSKYDSFIFDLSNDQFPPTDRSDFTHEEFADELTHIISPPEYDCFYFRNLPDSDEWISILNS
nr:hypothetical protein [Tanacetum cinerariifolium]